MSFKRARREKVWLKILLTGPSGSGKSYSALRLAKGLADACGSDIAYIGTEGSRDLYYASEYQFDLIQLSKDGNPREFTDFSPESYIHNIDEAVKQGYQVLCIDSISPEWSAILEMHEAMRTGNSFTNWGKVKPRHAAFMDKILTAPIHIICCSRAKDVYALEEDERGKVSPKKLGMGANTAKDVSYNMTVSFLLNDVDNHYFTVDKDNTHLFEHVYNRQLTEQDGINLYNWANESDIPATVKETKFEKPEAKSEPDINALQEEAVALCVSRGGRGS